MLYQRQHSYMIGRLLHNTDSIHNNKLYNNRRIEYDNEILLQFKEEMIAKQEAEQRAKAGADDFGGFGGFGGGASAAAGQGDDDDTKDETDSVAKEQVNYLSCIIITIYIPLLCNHVTIFRLLVHLLPLLVLVVWGFPHLMFI